MLTWPPLRPEKPYINLSGVEICSNDSWPWQNLLEAMHSGATVEISEAVYVYFRDVLPPHWMGSYEGHTAYVFCEGWDRPQLFWHAPDTSGYQHYFTQTFEDWDAVRRAVDPAIRNRDYLNL